MPFLGKSKTLFRLFGLPIKANLSWLFLVALVVFTLAKGYYPQKLGTGRPEHVYWALAAAGALGLFASLIAHELMHSLVARSTGMPVSGITLFIFGGVSQLEEEPPTALSEFLMAVVGPLTSVLIGSGFLALGFVGSQVGWPDTVQALIGFLSLVNFVLAAFNSLPAFPLDGGRVLRSILWGVTRDLRTATQVAANVGSFFGFGLIVLGIFTLWKGDFIGGIWLTVIGFFLRQAAAGSLQMVVMREQLAGDNVSRFMTTDVVTVPRDMSLEEFVTDYVFHHRFTYYPVVDEAGRMVGLVSARSPREVDQERWAEARIEDVMGPADERNMLSPDTDAVDALSALRQRDERRAVIVDEGRPVGIVSLRDLLQFLALKIDLEPRRGAFR
jgi:Zn-dependent protease/CBS domain-containing protein